MVNPIYASIILDSAGRTVIFPGENLKHHGNPKYMTGESSRSRNYISRFFDRVRNIERV